MCPRFIHKDDANPVPSWKSAPMCISYPAGSHCHCWEPQDLLWAVYLSWQLIGCCPRMQIRGAWPQKFLQNWGGHILKARMVGVINGVPTKYMLSMCGLASRRSWTFWCCSCLLHWPHLTVEQFWSSKIPAARRKTWVLGKHPVGCGISGISCAENKQVFSCVLSCWCFQPVRWTFATWFEHYSNGWWRANEP